VNETVEKAPLPADLKIKDVPPQRESRPSTMNAKPIAQQREAHKRTMRRVPAILEIPLPQGKVNE
jgi:hypothetical protein